MYTCPTAYTACAVCKHQPVPELHGTAIPPAAPQSPPGAGEATRRCSPVPTPMPRPKVKRPDASCPEKNTCLSTAVGMPENETFTVKTERTEPRTETNPERQHRGGKASRLSSSWRPRRLRRKGPPSRPPAQARLPHPWRGRALRSTASLP